MIAFFKKIFSCSHEKDREVIDTGESSGSIFKPCQHTKQEWIHEVKMIRDLPLCDDAKSKLRDTWSSLVYCPSEGFFEIYLSEKEKLLSSYGNEK